MERHQIKTQKQLVNLLTSHTQEAECEICEKPLGKLVIIPVDSPEDSNVITICDDCMVSVILKERVTWGARFLRWLRTLQGKQ